MLSCDRRTCSMQHQVIEPCCVSSPSTQSGYLKDLKDDVIRSCPHHTSLTSQLHPARSTERSPQRLQEDSDSRSSRLAISGMSASAYLKLCHPYQALRTPHHICMAAGRPPCTNYCCTYQEIEPCSVQTV